MILTPDLLAHAMPRALRATIARHLDSLNEGAERWQITTPRRIAAFLAQIGHESADLERTEENLDYSAEGLRKTWPTRFATLDIAQQYARRPEAIANLVYAGRMGNRDVLSGDGWRFIGRGCLMLSGRANYAAYAPWALDTPDWLADPPEAARSACWYWASRGLNELAEAGDEERFLEISRRINGGQIGKADRLARWRVAKAAVSEVIA